jgi:polyisoprenoid-binding protein YceI
MTTLQELLGSAESVGVWTLDPDRSTIGFKGKSMWGLAPVKGTYSEFSGDGQITNPTTVFGRIDIKAASVDTKLGKRDEHMRSADFFEVEKYPDISVVVTGAESVSDDTVNLRADLTVKATTKPVPLQVKVSVLDDGAVRLRTQADIDRKDFGVDGNLIGMVRDGVAITADVVFRRTGA